MSLHHKDALAMKKAKTLSEFLIQTIKDNEPITLGAFMSHALCHPDYGYYMTRDPFGVRGDFTTAPEISQMFGEMIGAWVIDIWTKMGQPKRFNLIECGAGRGTLMADIMRVAQKVKGFDEVVQIKIIESSPILKKIQKETIKTPSVEWIDNVKTCSVDEPCIILGNEFLDALPVEHFRFMKRMWKQCYIDISGDEFTKKWGKLQTDIETLLPQIRVHGAIYEIAPARIEFIKECAAHLEKSGGAALFVDYGYARSKSGETIQAVKNHEFVTVLTEIGECDITAHVDFESLLSVTGDHGMKNEPLVTQGDFLRSLGIEHRANALKNAALKQFGVAKGKEKAENIQNDLDRLIGQKQMGELFKVMCFHSGLNFTLAGF